MAVLTSQVNRWPTDSLNLEAIYLLDQSIQPSTYLTGQYCPCRPPGLHWGARARAAFARTFRPRPRNCAGRGCYGLLTGQVNRWRTDSLNPSVVESSYLLDRSTLPSIYLTGQFCPHRERVQGCLTHKNTGVIHAQEYRGTSRIRVQGYLTHKSSGVPHAYEYRGTSLVQG